MKGTFESGRLDRIVSEDGLAMEVDMGRLNRVLMVAHHLSSLAADMMLEAELLMSAAGKFRYEIKHTHREVRKLLARNHRHLFGRLSDKQIDKYGEDSDELEKLVYKWAGLPPMFSGIKIKGNSKPEKISKKFNG